VTTAASVMQLLEPDRHRRMSNHVRWETSLDELPKAWGWESALSNNIEYLTMCVAPGLGLGRAKSGV